MHNSMENIPYGNTAGPSGTQEIPAFCETLRSKAVLTTVYLWSLSWGELYPAFHLHIISYHDPH